MSKEAPSLGVACAASRPDAHLRRQADRHRNERVLHLTTRRKSTMIKALNGLPPGVIGFEASGKIAAEDYRDVVLPAVERAAKIGGIRFLMVMRGFDGIAASAVW